MISSACEHRSGAAQPPHDPKEADMQVGAQRLLQHRWRRRSYILWFLFIARTYSTSEATGSRALDSLSEHRIFQILDHLPKVREVGYKKRANYIMTHMMNGTLVTDLDPFIANMCLMQVIPPAFPPPSSRYRV